MEISASLVKELREATNVGMMECKKALQEAKGDKQQAIKILRERGMLIAGKKSSRVAKEGVVAALVNSEQNKGAIIELNCESDFAARTEKFKDLVNTLTKKALTEKHEDLIAATRDIITDKVAQIGENIVFRRYKIFEITHNHNGVIASYVHLGGKVGVMVEVHFEKKETKSLAIFQEAVKDLTLHITAAMPHYLSRDEVPADLVNLEKEIYAKQVVGKPANVIEKIVSGKLDKFYSQICLIEQPFVKDQNLSITQWLEGINKAVNDKLTIKRFVRYQLGEEA